MLLGMLDDLDAGRYDAFCETLAMKKLCRI